jgi:hypothetical protein
VKFTTATARATLSRGGVVYATGTAVRRRLLLHERKALCPARYTLTLTVRKGRRTITTHQKLTIR